MAQKKKNFPIKYMRKGLFTDVDNEKIDTKKRRKRQIRKPKSSVHTKTGKGRNK